MKNISNISFVGHFHFENDNKESYDTPELTIPLANNQYEAQQLLNGVGNMLALIGLVALIGTGIKAILEN